MRSKPSTPRFARGLLAAILSLGIAGQALADVTLLNVSYDPTRELYQEYNGAFAKYWKAQSGDEVVISQSHGGSGNRRAPWPMVWRPMSSRWRWAMTSMPSPSPVC